MNARIGIGVICGGLLPDDYRLPLDSQIVCVNATHRGKSYARNEALRQLQGCEHIFLFDDDCYPVLDGWADYLIDQDVQYMVLPDLQRSELVRSKGELAMWGRYVNDAMIYQSARALEIIGGFDESVMDDTRRTDRAIYEGLSGGRYVMSCPIRAMGYIRYDGSRSIQLDLWRDGHTYFPI